MFGIIYKATNLVNGKVYIGQTIRSLDERVRQHINDTNAMKDSFAFHSAIRKYGEDNFRWEVIDKAYSSRELDEKEVFWIKYYHSYISDDECNGYNMTIGGNVFRGKDNPFYGKTHSEESREKIRKSKIGQGIGNQYAKGKHTGKDNVMYRPIVQLTMDGKFVAEYETAIDGAKAVNGDNSTIGKVCKGRLKSHKGYRWLYKKDYESINQSR